LINDEESCSRATSSHELQDAKRFSSTRFRSSKDSGVTATHESHPKSQSDTTAAVGAPRMLQREHRENKSIDKTFIFT